MRIIVFVPSICLPVVAALLAAAAGPSLAAQEKAAPVVAAKPAAAAVVDRAQLARTESEAQAFAMLYRRLAELQVTPDVRIADFLAAGPDLRAFVWKAVCRQTRIDTPQVYSDGVTSVQVSVPLEQVIAQLKAVCSTYYRGDAFKPQDFDQVVLYAVQSSLWGIGESRGEPRLAIADTAPVGWYDIGVFGRLDARRQATDNAYRQLLLRIRALRFTASHRVAEFLDSDQRAADGVATFVRSRAEIGPVHYLPNRLAEIDLDLKLSDLVTELKGLSNAYNEAPEFAAEAFDGISTLNEEAALRVTGVAVPVSAAGEGPTEEVWPCTSEAEPPENVTDPDQAHLLALRAAVAQCRGELRQKLLDQPVADGAGGTRLGDWIAEVGEARKDVEALLNNLRVVQAKDLKGGRVRVTVEIPVARFHELLSYYAKVKSAAPESQEP